MSDPREPKKETVRITLPRPSKPAGDSNVSSGSDTVRINLPHRPPSISSSSALRPPSAPPVAHALGNKTGPVRPPPFVPPAKLSPGSSAAPPVPVFQPQPPVLGATAAATAAAIDPLAAPTVAPAGPKKETARITILPDPPAKPSGSVQMKKTQPLINLPDASIRPPMLNVAPLAGNEAENDYGVPMSLCWTVLGASALILLIQIWNYFA
jgi:hypothetical protein